MPSFLITDILSHESQTKVSKISSEYTTDHESSPVSPSLTPSSPSLDASAFIILSRYLNQSPSSLTDNLFPMMRTHCVENNRTDKKRHTCNKDESWKTHPLIDSLYKQTCFLVHNSDRSANESRENFVWPKATFPRSSGAFHPVRRTPISNDLLPGQQVRNSSIHVSGKGQQTDGLNTSRANQPDFTVSSLQILKNRESGRSVFSYVSEHEPVTVHTDSADSEELILRGLEDSDQCSGEDESAAKCPHSSPYGNNSALDALIHMTASSMQRLDRKVDKPTCQVDRLELCSINRGNQMTKRRKTRTTFSNSQLSELENNFNRQKYLTPNDRDRIAKHLGLSNTQVITWFQNRRAKLKREAEELERDILAARQQEQQKFLELNSQESQDGTTNCATENFIPKDRWNPPMKNRIHVDRAGEINDFKTRFSKSRRDLPSPNHWSDSSSISIPLNTKNNINEDDDEDDDEAIQPSTDDIISKATARKVALTVTRIISSRKKSVWSPAGELEMSIS